MWRRQWLTENWKLTGRWFGSVMEQETTEEITVRADSVTWTDGRAAGGPSAWSHGWVCSGSQAGGQRRWWSLFEGGWGDCRSRLSRSWSVVDPAAVDLSRTELQNRWPEQLKNFRPLQNRNGCQTSDWETGSYVGCTANGGSGTSFCWTRWDQEQVLAGLVLGNQKQLLSFLVHPSSSASFRRSWQPKYINQNTTTPPSVSSAGPCVLGSTLTRFTFNDRKQKQTKNKEMTKCEIKLRQWKLLMQRDSETETRAASLVSNQSKCFH